MPEISTPEHEKDLALAAALQAALLPKQCPTDCPHQRAAARNRMCETIGGDFHDFIRVNADQVAVVIGDVVGHGVRSSLLMAQIMGFLRSRPPEHLSRPVEIIDALNRMLIELGQRTETVLPCSAFYAVIDAPTGSMFFVNAGHPRPLLCADGRCETLRAARRNLLLGIQEYVPAQECHAFAAGQRIVLYTDGLIDASDPGGRRFGETRLHEAIRDSAGLSPEQCADTAFAAVDAFRQDRPQTDDETIVVIDRI